MRIVAVSFVGLLLCRVAAGEADWRSVSGPLVDRSAPLPGADLQGGKAWSQSTQAREPDRKPPAEETVRVTGAVVDRDGNPLAQAQVSFEGPRRGSAWTDAAGAFEFEGPIGDYGVRVKSGGKSQTFPVKITKRGLEPARLEFDKD
jgi:hypothetical protein